MFRAGLLNTGADPKLDLTHGLWGPGTLVIGDQLMVLHKLIHKVCDGSVYSFGIGLVVVFDIVGELVGDLFGLELGPGSALLRVEERSAVIVVILDVEGTYQLDQFVLRSLVHPSGT